jgi:hypothetical protein
MKTAALFILCFIGGILALTGPRCLELRLARIAIKLRSSATSVRSNQSSKRLNRSLNANICPDCHCRMTYESQHDPESCQLEWECWHCPGCLRNFPL